MDPNEPPPLETKPAPKFGFGAQWSCGVFVVMALATICWKANNPALWKFSLSVVPATAIIACFIRPVRGFAVGLLLGIGFAGIAIFSLCIASLKNI